VIGLVVLRYNGEPSSLELAVRSVLEPLSSQSLICDVQLVDNASTIEPTALQAYATQLRAEFNVRVSAQLLTKNYGFSGGVNRGIAALSDDCEFVLLINDDARLEPDALARMHAVLSSSPADVVSVAPKILLDLEGPSLIDAVGMAVSRKGEAKNVGLGQPDLGQFDTAHPVFGPCFAAALIRRSAFDVAEVGPLPESYFLYYEDVAWNWRAQLLGRSCMLVPDAVAFHRMSGSSRADDQTGGAAEQAYRRKHRYIERNLMITGTIHLPTADARRLWTDRFPGLVKSSVVGRFPKASRAAALGSLAALPASLLERRRIRQQTSQRRKADALRFWDAEPIHFDPVTYQPTYSWTALRAAAAGAGLPALAAACDQRSVEAAREAILALRSAEHRRNALEFLARIVV
jgi:GT2 family glycosyltransferase